MSEDEWTDVPVPVTATAYGREIATLRQQLQAAEAAEAPVSVNIPLLQRLQHAIVMCDEDADEHGLCECARAIGEELARFERQAKRAKRQLQTAEKARDTAVDVAVERAVEIAKLGGQLSQAEQERDRLLVCMAWYQSLVSTGQVWEHLQIREPQNIALLMGWMDTAAQHGKALVEGGKG